MGGRMITMSLDTDQMINPWDLPDQEKEPSKDQVAFLKNLTRHLLAPTSNRAGNKGLSRLLGSLADYRLAS
jgi:hypothetical protein